MTVEQIKDKMKEVGLSSYDMSIFPDSEENDVFGDNEDVPYADVLAAFGNVEEVDYQQDYEGDENFSISKTLHFKDHGLFIRIAGDYSDDNGQEWDDNDIQEVFPEEVKTVVYRTAEERQGNKG